MKTVDGWVWLLIEEDEYGEKEVVSAHRSFDGALAAACWRWSELGEVIGGDRVQPEDIGWTLDDGTGVLIDRHRLED
jgi:hypothetical protein